MSGRPLGRRFTSARLRSGERGELTFGARFFFAVAAGTPGGRLRRSVSGGTLTAGFRTGAGGARFSCSRFAGRTRQRDVSGSLPGDDGGSLGGPRGRRWPMISRPSVVLAGTQQDAGDRTAAYQADRNRRLADFNGAPTAFGRGAARFQSTACGQTSPELRRPPPATGRQYDGSVALAGGAPERSGSFRPASRPRWPAVAEGTANQIERSLSDSGGVVGDRFGHSLDASVYVGDSGAAAGEREEGGEADLELVAGLDREQLAQLALGGLVRALAFGGREPDQVPRRLL